MKGMDEGWKGWERDKVLFKRLRVKQRGKDWKKGYFKKKKKIRKGRGRKDVFIDLSYFLKG